MSSSATSDSSGRSIRYAMALGIGTVCSTPWSLRISLSAVQPWKVRNAEHIVDRGTAPPRSGRTRPTGRRRRSRRRTGAGSAAGSPRSSTGRGCPGRGGCPGRRSRRPAGRRRIRSGIQAVLVGVEPGVTVGLGDPLAVQERLHRGHPRVLPRLHLGARPVDRIDLGLRRLRGQACRRSRRPGRRSSRRSGSTRRSRRCRSPTARPACGRSGRGRPAQPRRFNWASVAASTAPDSMSA